MVTMMTWSSLALVI
jgi:hypothetical protein